jgi:hypothetical protein
MKDVPTEKRIVTTEMSPSMIDAESLDPDL